MCVPPFTLDDCSATDVELYADLPVSAAVSADQLAYFHTQVPTDLPPPPSRPHRCWATTRCTSARRSS